MKMFGADTNSGMIRKISDWFEMNFNLKLSPGKISPRNLFRRNPNHSEICVRVNAHESLPVRKKFSILLAENRLKINQNQSGLDCSKPNFQSELTRIHSVSINSNPDSFGLKI